MLFRAAVLLRCFLVRGFASASRTALRALIAYSIALCAAGLWSGQASAFSAGCAGVNALQGGTLAGGQSKGFAALFYGGETFVYDFTLTGGAHVVVSLNGATLVDSASSTSGSFFIKSDSGNLVIKNSGGGSVTFTNIKCAPAPPVIQGTNPSSASSAGGVTVVVGGRSLNDATSVTFGGTSATIVSAVNDYAVLVTIPAHAPGKVDVVVKAPGGSGVGKAIFTYAAPAPTVTSVTPSTGSTVGGTTVTITGTNFTGATKLSFGGSPATAVDVVSDTTITAKTPENKAGTVDVTVQTPGGNGIGKGLFTYKAPVPTVSKVSPSTGPTAGGTKVTITGTHFSDATAVFFDESTGTAMKVLNDTTITVATPAHVAGAVDIVVRTPGGNAIGKSLFTYQAPQSTNDSLKLRQMQIAATPVIAQISGQAITGAVDSAIGAAFSGNPQPFVSNGAGFTTNFFADPGAPPAATTDNGVRDFIAAPGQRGSHVDDGFSALGYARPMPTKAPAPRLRPLPDRGWFAWADVRGNSLRRDTTGDDLRGDQINALAGMTYKLMPDFLIGAFGGYEHFDYNSDALSGHLKGDGWTVGTYLGWRFTDTLRFDAMVARSGLNFDGTAGTASGSFPGSRWLASSGLTANYRMQGFIVEPSLRVYALWEREDAYTDSLGTLQAERKFSDGRASGGSKFGYPIAMSGGALTPYVGFYGDYYFNNDDATAIAGLGSTPLLQGWSARVTSGLTYTLTSGVQVGMDGEFGGLGSDTKIWTGRARASVPF